MVVPLAGQPPTPAGDTALGRLARRADTRLRELRTEADTLSARGGAFREEMRQLEADRQIKADELAAIDTDLTEMTRQLEEAEAGIAELAARVARQRPLVEARLVELYKMGAPRYARLLLRSGARDIGRAYRLLSTMARRDQTQFERHRQSVADLEASRAALAERQTEVSRRRGSAWNAWLAADRAIATQASLIEDTEARAAETAALADTLEAARAALAGGTGAVALPLAPFQGALTPPVAGEILAPFGVVREAMAGLAPGQGIELGAADGEGVRAVHGGEVTVARTIDGFAALVVLDHGGGSRSVYGRLEGLGVHEGVRVEQGALVGTAGAGADGTPAVYFELRVDGRLVDPIEWLE